MRFVVDPNCKNDNWRIEDLDELVIDQAAHMVSQKNILDDVLGEDRESEPEIDVNGIESRLMEIDKQESKLLDLYQIGSIPFENIASRLNALSTEKEALRQELQKKNDTPASDRFPDAVEAYQEGFRFGDTDTRRLLLSSIIERVAIDGKLVRVYWRV